MKKYLKNKPFLLIKKTRFLDIFKRSASTDRKYTNTVNKKINRSISYSSLSIQRKKTFNYLHFYFDNFSSRTNFTQENFISEIKTNFKLNMVYTIILRIHFPQNNVYRMLGSQIGLKLYSYYEEEYIIGIYDTILSRLDEARNLYEPILGPILGIELSYTTIFISPEVKLDSVNRINLPKDLMSKKMLGSHFSSKYLPMSININNYGRPIEREEKKALIGKINKTYDMLPHKSHLNINMNDIMTVYISDTRELSIRFNLLKYKYTIVVTKQINKDKFIRYVFEPQTLSLITSVEDLILDEKTANFTRKKGNITFYLLENKISKITIDVKLLPIKGGIKPLIGEINPSFGSFDLETFLDLDNKNKVYALGFFTNIDVKPITF